MNGEPTYPSAYDYYRTPSFENARALLRAVGLYVPYEATKSVTAAINSALADTGLRGPGGPGGPSAARGGGKRSRARTSPSSPSPPPSAQEADDAASIFHRADFIHDIHTNAVVDELVADRVLTTGIQIPTPLRRLLREHCNSASAGAYTNRAITTLEGHFGFRASSLSVHSIDSQGPLPSVKREHIIADAYMRDTVATWMKPNAAGVAELVFDGILDEPIERPAREGIHLDEAHLRSLATCAFLQLMIGEWPGASGAGGTSGGIASEIRFLTGTFQTLDVSMHQAFMDRWVSYLRRKATALKFVSGIQVVWLNADAVRGIASTGGARDVALALGEDSALIVHGRRVPFVAPKVASVSDGKTDPLGKFFETAPARQVTYAKKDLTDMFRYYIRVVEKQQADARVEAAVSQVLAVNAFRDAFKADVALARGAVYLTVDRLALVYYELRRAELGVANRGLAMTTSADGGGTMALKTYRGARAV